MRETLLLLVVMTAGCSGRALAQDEIQGQGADRPPSTMTAPPSQPAPEELLQVSTDGQSVFLVSKLKGDFALDTTWPGGLVLRTDGTPRFQVNFAGLVPWRDATYQLGTPQLRFVSLDAVMIRGQIQSPSPLVESLTASGGKAGPPPAQVAKYLIVKDAAGDDYKVPLYRP